MNDVEMVEKAKAICRQAHEGQVDKGGDPYYLHPYAVADMVDGAVLKTIAYLHDVVEDTLLGLTDLSDMGFPEDVVKGVDSMTHRDDESYWDYIDRVKLNPLAVEVKKADLRHNSNPTRPNLTTQQRKKYLRALKELGE